MINARVAEAALLMLGGVLSDIRNLGGSESSIREAVFREKHPEPFLSAYDYVVALNHGLPFGPDLTLDLREVYDVADADPLALILLLSQTAATVANEPPIFPLEVLTGISAKPDDSETAYCVADGHLHSGATLSLTAFLNLLLAGTNDLRPEVEVGAETLRAHSESLKLSRIHASDAAGISFSIGVVVGGLRVHLSRVMAVGSWTSPKPTCSSLLSQGLFWETLRKVALDFGGDPDLLEELFSACSDEPIHFVVADLLAALNVAMHNPGQKNERRELLGLFSAMCLIKTALTSGHGEGLGRFVDRFERMGIIRDVGVGRNRRLIVAEAAHVVFSSPRVVAAEFRKTFVASGKSVQRLESSITGSLSEHLLGLSDFARRQDRAVRVGMPIGYLRDRSSPMRDNERFTARYNLAAVSRLTNAFLNVRRQYPTVRQYVSGCDVAGDEAAMPNWPFLIAFDFLRSVGLMDLDLSVHAGESFNWRLQGLRRIGEVVESCANVDRIGHALALDDLVSESVMGRPPGRIRSLEVVSDLCWVLSWWPSNVDAQMMLEEVCDRLNLDAENLAWTDLVEGWRALHSYRGAVEVGLCALDERVSGEDIDAFLDYCDPWAVTTRSAKSRAAWHLAYHRPGLDLFEPRLSAQLTQSYLDLQDRIAQDALAHVLDGIKGRGDGIVIEACPSSNARLAGLRAIKATHAERLMGLGLRVSVSSDDPFIFGTNVEREFSLLEAAFGRGVAETCAMVSVASCCSRAVGKSASDLERDAEALANY